MSSELESAVRSVEEHVAEGGWDQPARMFALARGSELAAAEPDVAASLGIDPDDGAFVPIEQDWPDDGRALDEVLATIGWPEEVHGCVVVVERMVLPEAAEQALVDEGFDPAGREFAVRAAAHEARRDVRMSVGVLRDGSRACRLRVQQTSGDETFTDGPDLVPGLSTALLGTFAP